MCFEADTGSYYGYPGMESGRYDAFRHAGILCIVEKRINQSAA